MQNSKKLKKWGITVVASLVISTGFPAGITHAATLESGKVHSIISQIFSQFGWKWDASKIANAESINHQIRKPAKTNQSENSGQEANTENNNASQETEQEQSNDQQAAAPEQQGAPAQEQAASEQNTALADKIIATGEKYLGTPYEFGARAGQTSTFDCSSFVQHVFKENGIDLPRNSRQQSQVGTTVSKSELQKGDLLFFELRSNPGRIGHVGIYAGNNKILHTWGPGGVRYDDLSDKWLKEGYVTAKRVIQ
ncbi:MAG: NlpC/P60 family protein [Thermoactinomyces sp.]